MAKSFIWINGELIGLPKLCGVYNNEKRHFHYLP